jgi:hypothetical protein
MRESEISSFIKKLICHMNTRPIYANYTSSTHLNSQLLWCSVPKHRVRSSLNPSILADLTLFDKIHRTSGSKSNMQNIYLDVNICHEISLLKELLSTWNMLQQPVNLFFGQYNPSGPTTAKSVLVPATRGSTNSQSNSDYYTPQGYS